MTGKAVLPSIRTSATANSANCLGKTRAVLESRAILMIEEP